MRVEKIKRLLYYVAGLALIGIGGLTLGQLDASTLQKLTIVVCLFISGMLVKTSLE